MPYQPLDGFAKAWIFKRSDPFIQPEDLAHIKPFSELRANQVWRDYISQERTHPDHLNQKDWSQDPDAIGLNLDWQPRWESDDEPLPDEVLAHLENWQDDNIIYFCYHQDDVIETSYGVFKRSWKNFLFFDNGPLLLGKKKKQAVQFFSDGTCTLLSKKS